MKRQRAVPDNNVWIASDSARSARPAGLKSLETQLRNYKIQTQRLEGQVTTRTGQIAALTVTVSRLERETVKRTRRSPGQQADDASFIAAGFDPTPAAKLVKQVGKFGLGEMYLRDHATREGWIGTPKYGEEQAALPRQNEAFRAELSEDEYSRFLYATGRPNRITLESVMGELQAEWVGSHSGDHIVRYAGEFILTYDGLASMARLELWFLYTSNGRVVELTIERGPLGLRLGTETVKP